MNIREATKADFDSIWPIFQEVVAAGDTYAYSPDSTKEQAFHLWMEIPRDTFVIECENKILGTYYIKTNQSDQENMFVTVDIWFPQTQEARV